MFGEPLLAHPAECASVDATWRPHSGDDDNRDRRDDCAEDPHRHVTNCIEQTRSTLFWIAQRSSDRPARPAVSKSALLSRTVAYVGTGDRAGQRELGCHSREAMLCVDSPRETRDAPETRHAIAKFRALMGGIPHAPKVSAAAGPCFGDLSDTGSGKVHASWNAELPAASMSHRSPILLSGCVA